MTGKRIAILVENQYQELELWFPLLRSIEEGIEARIVGTGSNEVFNGRYGFPARAETTATSVNSLEFDGVIIPGGFAPDYLRRFPAVLNLVKEFYQEGKLVGAIGHGSWVLVSAGLARGKRIAGAISIRDDIENAGGEFVDQPTVRDGNLVTARSPQDLPFFIQEVLSLLWRQKPRLKIPHPSGRLIDLSGETRLLSEIIAAHPALLFFYPCDFHPFIKELLPQLNPIACKVKEQGGIFLGISPDSYFTHGEFLKQVKLEYPLWSDPGAEVAKSYGVLESNYSVQTSVFLIDKNGILRYGEDCPSGRVEELPGFSRALDAILPRGR
ncbi:MAG: protease [Candidatus Atribacteria bacterium]|nr:protease [Candidatus Atribacteria bacterium]